MTAARLALDPIFDADPPSEQYAYRPGRNAQQAVLGVQETLSRGHPNATVAAASLRTLASRAGRAELPCSGVRHMWLTHVAILHFRRAAWREVLLHRSGAVGHRDVTMRSSDDARPQLVSERCYRAWCFHRPLQF